MFGPLLVEPISVTIHASGNFLMALEKTLEKLDGIRDGAVQLACCSGKRDGRVTATPDRYGCGTRVERRIERWRRWNGTRPTAAAAVVRWARCSVGSERWWIGSVEEHRVKVLFERMLSNGLALKVCYG